jgi:hypothetical protein
VSYGSVRHSDVSLNLVFSGSIPVILLAVLCVGLPLSYINIETITRIIRVRLDCSDHLLYRST